VKTPFSCGAEFLDHEFRMRRLSGRGRVEYRLNAILGGVRIAGQLEVDQHRVTILRDESRVLER
jgi:hypothetical protein